MCRRSVVVVDKIVYIALLLIPTNPIRMYRIVSERVDIIRRTAVRFQNSRRNGLDDSIGFYHFSVLSEVLSPAAGAGAAGLFRNSETD